MARGPVRAPDKVRAMRASARLSCASAPSLGLRVLLCTFLAAPLGCGDAGSGDENMKVSVSITSPRSTSYVRDTVTVQVVVNEGKPDSVELLLGGEVLARLVAPYQYAWDTSQAPEGNHLLAARVHQGSATATSPSILVVVDRTPPELVYRSPTPGSPEEWNGEILFTASEPLAPDTLTDGRIQLLAGASAVRTKRELSEDMKTVRLLVDEPLPLPVEMTLGISAQVTDLAGNPLILPVGAWSWHAPAWRLLGASVHKELAEYASASHSSLLMLSNGQPVVAYEELITDPYYSKGPIVAQWNGGRWDRIGPLNTRGQGRLSQGPFGDLYFAWTEGSDLQLLRRQGTAWMPLYETTGSDSSIVDTRLQLSVTSSGVAGIAKATLSEDGEVASAIYIGGSEPWREVRIQPQARIYALAMDTGKRAWVVSQGTGLSALKVMRLREHQSSDVGDTLQVEAGTTLPAQAADLKFEADGTPVVAWRDAELLHVQRWNGTAWVKLGTSQEVGGVVSAEDSVSLALGPDNRPVVAWIYRPPPPALPDLRVTTWTGSIWNTLLRGEAADPYNGPSLALDGEGRAVVAWHAPSAFSAKTPVMRVRANR